jgi:hypothetical protein
MGFDLVRMAWLTADPASAEAMTWMLAPVCCWKLSMTDWESANAPWVSSRTVDPAGAMDASGPNARGPGTVEPGAPDDWASALPPRSTPATTPMRTSAPRCRWPVDDWVIASPPGSSVGCG